MTDSLPMRVLSIPAGHPYVQHTLGGISGVVVLDDPTTPWWPPLGLDPTWVDRHRDRFDVIHVHFGFEQIDPGQLDAWCTATTDLDLPVVVTAHDLRNPHLQDNALHERQLAILLERADVVLTLTEGAAAEIEQRYGKRAVVVPHPHLLPLGHPVAPTRPATVGMYYGSGRANLLPPHLIVPEVAAACSGRDGTLTVRVHAHARSELRDELRSLQQRVGFELRVGPVMDDAALFADVGALHVGVLPYRFGTHSGWVELCRDVGTRVVAPACGHFAGQWADIESFATDGEHGPMPGQVRHAVERALDRPAPGPAGEAWRAGQREMIGAAHRTLYGSLLPSATPAAAAG